MENRFLFRIWDIEEGVYLKRKHSKTAGYTKYTLGGHSVWLDLGHFIDNAKTQGVIIEQCTGVKDTNDNLIYENDIVEQSPSGNKYKIIWIDTDCGWGLKNAQTGFIRTMNCFDGDELEIIGNIHETTGK